LLKRGLSGRGSNLLKSDPDRPLTSRTPGCAGAAGWVVAYGFTLSRRLACTALLMLCLKITIQK
jgi:hypothetical protein